MEIEEKLRKDNESSVQGAWPRPIHTCNYKPGALNRSFIVRPQFSFNFRSNSVQFLFDFCSISIGIQLNGTRSKKADELTHCQFEIIVVRVAIEIDIFFSYEAPTNFSLRWS